MAAAQDDSDSSKRVYLVEEQPNPSTDFFVLPALSAARCRVVRCGFSDLPDAAELNGAIVVFVRYVPKAWMRLVASAREQVERLIFFMDDDVLDVAASMGMPSPYRLKLAQLAALRKSWLRRQAAELWVSTPYLQKKYAKWQPRLVLPSAPDRAGQGCRIFYHGSASHAAEIRWLRPVMEQVLDEEVEASFEIVGGGDVYRLYRGLPRVNVVHPMKWPAYQAFLALPGRHVGLVPLLDRPFNRARSCTKFFDITHCGAVGVYASNSACAGLVEDGVDGLLAGQVPEAWVRAILRLARDEQLRQRLLRNAKSKQVELSGRAQDCYVKLFDRESDT